MDFIKFSFFLFLFSFSILVQCSAHLPVSSRLPDSEDPFVNIDFKKSNITENVTGFSHEPLEVRYFMKCGDSSEVETQVPEKVELGDSVQLSSNFNINKCNSDKSLLKQTIKLKSTPQGIMVEIHAESDCNCHMPDAQNDTLMTEKSCQIDSSSEICSSKGDCTDGSCSCYAGYTGLFCENVGDGILGHRCSYVGELPLCNGDGHCIDGSCSCIAGYTGQFCEKALDEWFCKFDENSLVCSGQGNCVNGKCKCETQGRDRNEIINGKYCECTNFKCNIYNGSICGNNGKCECNRCICDEGWKGESCEISCSTTNSTQCVNPETGDICSSNGECRCGECICENNFDGNWCQNTNHQCDNLRHCTACKGYSSGIYSAEKCEQKCSNINVTQVDSLIHDRYHKVCRSEDLNRCLIFFSYAYNAYNEGRPTQVYLGRRFCKADANGFF